MGTATSLHSMYYDEENERFDLVKSPTYSVNPSNSSMIISWRNPYQVHAC